MNLKLLTLNLHCLAEENLDDKQNLIVEEIIKNDIDIIFLQEVAQSSDKPIIYDHVKEDNYGFVLKDKLKNMGYRYNYYFDAFKHSFDKCDEGLAILSKTKLDLLESKYISNIKDYNNWKTRKVLIYRMSQHHINLATSHFGWSDETERFEEQFDRAIESFKKNELTILAGDFNISYNSKEYHHILKNNFIDIFSKKESFINQITFKGDPLNKEHRRLDYFFTNQPVMLIDQKILFKDKRVSDHFGVYVEIKLGDTNETSNL
ncbi:endonuclease/exonuclease/phosphatase family protein [Candidatus Izemoplasma sp. B36]|uniref:endonuclease/exonuclease/phosphatase family protein n=1 Tax=Candidatus Izemoplasma sp. B36 TaxID=3242468 RepID=UPI003555C157